MEDRIIIDETDYLSESRSIADNIVFGQAARSSTRIIDFGIGKLFS